MLTAIPWRHAESIDQERNRKDGSPASGQPERKSHKSSENDRQQGHQATGSFEATQALKPPTRSMTLERPACASMLAAMADR